MRLARLAALTLLAACNAQPDPAEPETAPPSPEDEAAPAETEAAGTSTAEELALRDRAVTALRGEDFETALEIVEGVLVGRYLETARELLAEEPPNPQDGLLWLDRALDIDDRRIEAHVLRGEGNVMLAEQLIAEGANGLYITGSFEDALASFSDAILRDPDNARALLGASRAAYQLSRFDDALRYARRGTEAIEAGADASAIEPAPERILAEAAYRAYVEAKTGTPTDENGEADESSTEARRARELFELTETTLGELMLGDGADDPWIWSTLANLYQWEERIDDAKAQLRRGLDRVPTDADLLRRLVELSRANGGSRAALVDINAFVNAHPDVAGGYWWLGYDRFEAAMENLGPDTAASPAEFEAAERAFQQARELDPTLVSACKGYEVVCRNARGWAFYWQDELEKATEAFLSTNEIFPRGVEWRIEGRLFAAWEGLDFVGAAYNERGDWASAAATYEILRELQPDRAVWANNAGFFHRDDGVALELLGRDLCRRSQNPPTSETEITRLLERAGIAERPQDLGAALHARADELLAQARTALEASDAAYRDLERLAPHDVRYVNDAALVMIYYVRKDLDLAKEFLARCIELGEEQMQDPTLEGDDRETLENAWGDAFQNMGFLLLVHMENGVDARPFFERALELGDPRPQVTGEFLPLCDADPDHPRLVELRSWGVPCADTPPAAPGIPVDAAGTNGADAVAPTEEPAEDPAAQESGR